MKKMIFGLAIVFVSLMSGCASVPMASPEADARAKEFKAHPTKASVYIYRNETMGGAIKMPITMDGKVIGSSAPNTYFHMLVSPGKHTVNSLTENTATLSFDAKAKKKYFIWQEVKMGMWAAASALHMQSESEGKRGVLECNLASPSNM